MPQRIASPARVAAFTFGVQVVWGALLGVSLQARATELAPAWKLEAYAFLAGWGAAMAATSQLAAGYTSDSLRKRGSRRVEFYIGGTVLACAGLIWFYNARTFASLFGAILAVQLAMNVAIAAYQAAIPDLFDDERMGRASSWMAGLQSLGNAFGAVFAGLLRGPLVWIGIVLALTIACGITASHVARFIPSSVKQERLTLTGAFVDLFISRALVFLGFYTLVDYLFFYIGSTVGERSASAYTGYTLLIVTASAAIGAAVIARAADRWDRRALACVGAIVLLAGIGVLVGAHSWTAIAPIAACAGIGWGAFLTADWALGCRFTARAHAATTLAVWNLALLIPQVIAPALATAVIRAIHASSALGPRVAFLLAIVELCCGAAWLWRLPAYARNKPSEYGNIA